MSIKNQIKLIEISNEMFKHSSPCPNDFMEVLEKTFKRLISKKKSHKIMKILNLFINQYKKLKDILRGNLLTAFNFLIDFSILFLLILFIFSSLPKIN